MLRRRDAGDATAGEVDVRRRWRLPGVARALPKCRGGRWCVSVRDRVRDALRRNGAALAGRRCGPREFKRARPRKPSDMLGL